MVCRPLAPCQDSLCKVGLLLTLGKGSRPKVARLPTLGRANPRKEHLRPMQVKGSLRKRPRRTRTRR